MPLVINPVFNFCAVDQGSLCEATVQRYHAGKTVLCDTVTKLKLNAPAIQVIIQKGDRLRATKIFAGVFPINSDNGASYYFRVPVSYDGTIIFPDQTMPVTDPHQLRSIREYLATRAVRFTYFGNARTIPVPADFTPEKHNFVGTAHWLSHNMEPA